MSERSERVGRSRERRRRRPRDSRSTRATTATTPQDPPRAADPERRPVHHPARGGAAHDRGRLRRPSAGGRTLTSSYTGRLRCGIVGAGGSYGGVVVARSAATPVARPGVGGASLGRPTRSLRSLKGYPSSVHNRSAPKKSLGAALSLGRQQVAPRPDDHGRQTRDFGASLRRQAPTLLRRCGAGPRSL